MPVTRIANFASDVSPAANRRPQPPVTGRFEHPCSTAADQGWSALPFAVSGRDAM